MTETISSVLQGLIQGLTEYLPVSSSGHLSIFQNLTGTGAPDLLYDLTLHLATVCATLVYFGKDIVKLLIEFFKGFRPSPLPKDEGWYFGWAVIFGSIPTAVIGLLLEPAVKGASSSMIYIGVALIVTAMILWVLSYIPQGNRKICISIGLIVGIAQGVAVFPGISRSGMTLAAALICGLKADEAFRFSFLLALPAICGASLLEFLKAGTSNAVLPAGWGIGAACAFLSGLAALYLLHRTVVRGQWKVFSIYCAAAGLLALVVL